MLQTEAINCPEKYIPLGPEWISPLFDTAHIENNYFWTRKSFFASSIKLLSCCCSWANRVSFEHGWSYRKNSNAGKFVFPYWFIHKNFRLVRGPVFCPVSGFCTSDGPIEKITMQATLYSHTGSSIKISGWSGVRFSVRFPVFVLLMVLSKKFQCRKICILIQVHP